MSDKKQVIGKDGLVKTVVKSESSREARIREHMHGRNDHFRTTDGDTRWVLGLIVGVVCLILTAVLLIKLLG